MKWTAADYAYMSRALQLARNGLYSTAPNPRVGCVLVKNGKILAEGWHQTAGQAHAEIHALAQAGAAASGADCYVTLEPCSHTGRTGPCADTLIKAGIKRVIAAMQDPNPDVCGDGVRAMSDAGIKVETGLLQIEAQALNPGFIKRMTQGLPYVRCKLAMSLDGKTALRNGESKWISGEAARMDVQRLRARSCVVMTGIGTVLSDNPRLNVREVDTCGRQVLRVIIDRELRCPVDASIFKSQGRTLIFTNKNKSEEAALRQAGAEVFVMDCNDGSFLTTVLSHLSKYEQVNEVLLEAGAGLAGSMLSQGLVDELVLYQAPSILGDSAKGLFSLPSIQHMDDKIQLVVFDRRLFGDDMRIMAKVKHD